MKRPLVILVVFYCLGIVFARLTQINFWVMTWIAVFVFLGSIAASRKNLIFLILVLFLALLIGYLNLKNSWVLSNCHIRKLVAYRDSSFYRLNGFIASQPEFKNSHFWFIFRVREMQVNKLNNKCCGEVLVKMDAFGALQTPSVRVKQKSVTLSGHAEQSRKLDFKQALNYGDNLILTGKLGRPPNFGQSRSYRDFLARQNIYLTMSIKDRRQIIRRDNFQGSGIISACFRLRVYLEQVISRHLPAIPASILTAMVLGQKRNIPWRINNAMVKSGTVHILVVSGFNVGIVALVVNLLLKIMRFPRQGRIILTAVCLILYCFITGATNPVIRATVMGLVFLAAHLLKREPDIYNSLFSAALFILTINPRQIFDISFQLSFMSVLAIVYIYPKLKTWVHLDAWPSKIIKFIVEGCLVSFSAWLGTLVINALNFRMITLVTVLANMLIVPLATLITLCGFTLLLVGLICPALANLFSLPIVVLVTLLLNINSALIKLPFAYIYL